MSKIFNPSYNNGKKANQNRKSVRVKMLLLETVHFRCQRNGKLRIDFVFCFSFTEFVFPSRFVCQKQASMKAKCFAYFIPRC